MSDKQKKVFVWTLAVLATVLILFAAGCGIGAEKVKVLQTEVAAVGSVAIDNPKLTQWDKTRLRYHLDRINGDLEGLK